MPLPQKEKDVIDNLRKCKVKKDVVDSLEQLFTELHKDEIRRKKLFKKLGLKWPD